MGCNSPLVQEFLLIENRSKYMSTFADLRNKLMIGCIGTTAFGVLLWFSPNSTGKALSMGVSAIGLSGMLASQLIIDESEKRLDVIKKDTEKFKTNTNKNSKLINVVLAQSLDVTEKQNQKLAKLSEGIIAFENLNNEQSQQLAELNTQVIEDGKQLEAMGIEFQLQMKNALSVDANIAVDFLNETLETFKVETLGLIQATKHHYPELVEKLDSFAIKVDVKIQEFQNQVNYIATLTTCSDLIENSIALQHQIIYHLGVVKANIYQSQIRQLKLELEDCMLIDNHNEIVDDINTSWTKKYQLLAGNIESIRQEFSGVANEVIGTYNTEWNEMISQGLQGEELIASLKAEIIQLQNTIHDLRKPLLFVGGSNKSENGNRVINYYHKKGIVLDSFDWEEVDTGYKLFFYVGRNGGKFISEDLLNEENNDEKIRDLCECLNLPKFKRSTRGGHFTLEIQTSLPIKVDNNILSEASVGRICRNFETWLKAAKKYNRVRITGGSGAGKSPLTEKLVSAIMQFKKVKSFDNTFLYNPQSGSRKDFWTIPATGISHDDNPDGIENLESRCTQKYNDGIEIYIFDETDSNLRKHKGKGIADKIKNVMTQIDHTSCMVFFLGQSPGTKEYSGFIRGDWNNIVNIHINQNAIDAIELDPGDVEEADKLIKQATQLKAYYDAKNQELGLDKDDPGAYRFTLVDEYGMKRYFVELPPFQADTFLESLASQQQSSNPKNDATSANSVQTVQLNCPKCGSTNIGSKNKDYHRCKDCQKTWKKELINRN